MTPQAQDIVDRFMEAIWIPSDGNDNPIWVGQVERENAIQCAIVAVEMRYYESYKQGTEMSLIRQEYWQYILTELKNEL